MIPSHSAWSRWAGGRGRRGVGRARLSGGKRPLTVGSVKPWWHEVAISETGLPGSPAPASRSAHQPTPGDTRVRRPHSGDAAGMGDASHHPLCGSERSPVAFWRPQGLRVTGKRIGAPGGRQGSRLRTASVPSGLLPACCGGPGGGGPGPASMGDALPPTLCLLGGSRWVQDTGATNVGSPAVRGAQAGLAHSGQLGLVRGSGLPPSAPSPVPTVAQARTGRMGQTRAADRQHPGRGP